MTLSTPPIVEWAVAHLRASADAKVTWNAVPSRVGHVYRLAAFTLEGQKTYFAKNLAIDDAHIAVFQAISSKFAGRQRIAYADIAALDLTSRWVLVSAAEGVNLIAWRRQVLLRGSFWKLVSPWAAIGEWLRVLHTAMSPCPAPLAVQRIAEYTVLRIERWAEVDPSVRTLAMTATDLISQAAHRPGSWHVVPCHGDVSAGNIIVGQQVTLIDFDDFRFDLPAVDLSQALLELREYARVASRFTLPLLTRQCERSLREGYGQNWPRGPEWYLPHLRNLAVFLLTLASRRSEPGIRDRYRRTRREFETSLAAL